MHRVRGSLVNSGLSNMEDDEFYNEIHRTVVLIRGEEIKLDQPVLDKSFD